MREQYVWELNARKQWLIMMGLVFLSLFVQTYCLSPKIKKEKKENWTLKFTINSPLKPCCLSYLVNGHITILNALRSCFFFFSFFFFFPESLYVLFPGWQYSNQCSLENVSPPLYVWLSEIVHVLGSPPDTALHCTSHALSRLLLSKVSVSGMLFSNTIEY